MTHPVPAVASLLDVQTLVSALQVVLEPMTKVHAEAIKDIREDIDSKHEENRDARHASNNRFEIQLNQVALDVAAARERVLKLEIQIQGAVGVDGQGGAIRQLQDGQSQQTATTQRIEGTVNTMKAQMDLWAPTMIMVQAQHSATEHLNKKRDSSKEWAELLIKYGTILGVAYEVLRYLHR